MGLYDYIFAEGYDLVLLAPEWSALGKKRKALIGRARGRVLEIGAGTGVNLKYYRGIEELVICEPGVGMARKLAKAVKKTQYRVELVDAVAEEIPFADNSFDTVVSTMVLCSVEDVAQSLKELSRVLKPSGSYLFLEHVRSANTNFAWFQDKLYRPWKAFGNGCNCNRDLLADISASPFELKDRVEQGFVKLNVPIVAPYIMGEAKATTISHPNRF